MLADAIAHAGAMKQNTIWQKPHEGESEYDEDEHLNTEANAERQVKSTARKVYPGAGREAGCCCCCNRMKTTVKREEKNESSGYNEQEDTLIILPFTAFSLTTASDNIVSMPTTTTALNRLSEERQQCPADATQRWRSCCGYVQVDRKTARYPAKAATSFVAVPVFRDRPTFGMLPNLRCPVAWPKGELRKGT